MHTQRVEVDDPKQIIMQILLWKFKSHLDKVPRAKQNNRDLDHELPDCMDTLRGRRQQGTDSHTSPSDSVPPIASPGTGRGKGNMKRHKRAEFGHLAKDCPKPRREQTRTTIPSMLNCSGWQIKFNDGRRCTRTHYPYEHVECKAKAVYKEIKAKVERGRSPRGKRRERSLRGRTERTKSRCNSVRKASARSPWKNTSAKRL